MVHLLSTRHHWWRSCMNRTRRGCRVRYVSEVAGPRGVRSRVTFASAVDIAEIPALPRGIHLMSYRQ
jgi:hypothetical protein